MTWGVEGAIAIREMANRAGDINAQELMPFIKQYYIGRVRTNSDKSAVLRKALKVLGYKGKIIGRIHVNQADYVSIRKRELSLGFSWRLKRDNCEKCGSIDRLKLHHIVPLSWGGLTSRENCITLCETCHRLAHKSLSKSLNRGLLLEYLIPHKEEIYKKAITAFITNP
jgi:5-methylcytosine-specific restriction endonuclease McrA